MPDPPPTPPVAVIYRGCADGWTSSSIETDYVGCRVQSMWGRDVEWCFCTESLCNGDSMTRISDKYNAQLEPFRGQLEVTEVIVVNAQYSQPPRAYQGDVRWRTFNKIK